MLKDFLATIAGSRFSVTNISENSTQKSKGLEKLCKGPMPNRYVPKNRKIGLVDPTL
jgi:hypothetical protein